MTRISESENKQANELENAILRRAQALADEQHRQAREAIERIRQEAAERLHLREEREVLLAKAAADRAYHRNVQASEIRMQADLDRLRWELVQGVMEKLKQRLLTLVDDEHQYIPLFHNFLKQAVDGIERDTLIAEVTPQDYARLKDRWASIVEMLAPDKTIELRAMAENARSHCIGGVRVCSEDQRICVDNTFHGKLARIEEEIQQIILSRLLPSSEYMNLLFNA